MKPNLWRKPVVLLTSAVGLSVGCSTTTASSHFADPTLAPGEGSSPFDASAFEGSALDASFFDSGAATRGMPPQGMTATGGPDASDGAIAMLDSAVVEHAMDATPAAGNELHVEQNRFYYNGKPTRLLGVNHSGSEYTCLSSGIFEGPDADTIATGILSWGNINTVRVPLNEDCWLGINGVNGQYSGANYQNAIVSYVSKLHAHGLFVIVDLHWNAPGSFLANAQQPMADADHAVDFWKSVAGKFKSDPMTVFDLYNEPYLDNSNAQTSDPWECWLNGCTVTQGRNGVSGNWQSAGMQSMLDAVRSTGATNVVMAGGLNFSDDLTQWLAHVPNDPLHQVAASLHAYAGGPCAVSSCWTSVLEPIAAKYPIVTGELGEYDCGHSFVDSFFAWADKAGVSYIPWTWNTWDCGGGPSLITDYNGTATGFGEGYQIHMQSTKP